MIPNKELKIHQEDYRQMRCPVGNEMLGYREPWESTEIYCKDCNHTYKFEQYNAKPIGSYRGRREDKMCGCLVCQDRASK